MTRCVIGVDGGGTKTACEIASLEGTPLARTTGGPSNYQTIGPAATEAVLTQTIAEAAREAGSEVEIHGLCLAMAGVDRPDDLRAVREIAGHLLDARLPHLIWMLDAGRVVI